MFFRRQKGEYRETDRVTRYKLIKSGKHWLRASTSLFGLFKVLRGGVDTTQVMTEVVEDKVNSSITGLDIIKGLAATGAVLGVLLLLKQKCLQMKRWPWKKHWKIQIFWLQMIQ